VWGHETNINKELYSWKKKEKKKSVFRGLPAAAATTKAGERIYVAKRKEKQLKGVILWLCVLKAGSPLKKESTMMAAAAAKKERAPANERGCWKSPVKEMMWMGLEKPHTPSPVRPLDRCVQ